MLFRSPKPQTPNPKPQTPNPIVNNYTMIAAKRSFEHLSKSAAVKDDIHFVRNGIRVSLVKGDMTEEITDAIVNAANERLRHGGGLAAMIVKAGGSQIVDESREVIRKQGKVPTGTCAYTKAGNLGCRYVIHAVGPIWSAYKPEEARNLLKMTIRSVYDQALELNLGSISLTAISSGIFDYPNDLCAKDILSELTELIDSKKGSLDYVRICIFDQPTYEPFSAEFKTYMSN